MIGARDMAFPRLNMLSCWLFLFGGVVLYASHLLHAAGGRLDLLRAAVANRVLARRTASTPGSSGSTSSACRRSSARSTSSSRSTTCARPAWAEPDAAVRLDDPGLLVPDHPRARPRSPRRSRCCWSTATSTALLRPDRRAARRCCGSTCSGSWATPRSTSWCCPRSGWSARSIPVFARKPIFGYGRSRPRPPAIAFLGMLVWAHHMFADAAARPRARLLHALELR